MLNDMKTITALGIAEHIWNDIVEQKSFEDVLKQWGLNPEDMTSEQSKTILQTKGVSIREETIAHWANVIQEFANHEGHTHV
jgi:hypothetical protein